MEDQQRQIFKDQMPMIQEPAVGQGEYGSESDNEDFCSAMSHISDDVGHILFRPEPQLPHVLSDAEHQRLDDKINQLIEALTSGRQVNFTQDPVTSVVEVEVTAEYSDRVSGAESGCVEANIAAWPENFGHIISNCRQMLESPNSIVLSWSTTESLSHTQHNWDAAVTAADERYELQGEFSLEEWERQKPSVSELRTPQHRDPVQEGHTIQAAVRLQEQEAGEPRGRRLVRMGLSGPEIYPIFPLPLNFNKAQRETTPSGSSGEAHIDRSSPLFRKSKEQRAQSTHSWTTVSSDEYEEAEKSSERVTAWLNQIETPRQTETKKADKRKARSFGVFQESGDKEPLRSNASKSMRASKALKDVSNVRQPGLSQHKATRKSTENPGLVSRQFEQYPTLRQPGYLRHNSFAVQKASRSDVKRTAKSTPPSHGFGGALNEESRRSYIEEKRPGLLDRTIEAADEAIQGAIRGTLKVALEPAQPQPPAGETPAADRLSHPDPERAAHFERALARLEGRAPPETGSPIRRYVHNEELYGDDVDVDLRLVRFRQPQPLRPTDGKAAHRLVQMFGDR